MKKIILTILLIAMCVCNSFAQSVVMPEEYSVYAGVFEKRYEKNNIDKSITRIAILENTIQPDYGILVRYLVDKRTEDYLYSTEPSGSIDSISWKESVKDLERINRDTKKLEDQFSIEYKYNLITKNEIDQLAAEGKKELFETIEKCKCVFTGAGAAIWQPFFRKYRNSSGYYSFSRVGFSRDKQFAAVFVKTESGDQGDSTFYVLRKTENKWKAFKYFGSSWVND